MEQTKALNAIEPYLALSKSATSPRAAADLAVRATSDPNTFVFAELLQTPQVQALESSSELSSYYVLLQIFSYGTYGTYISTPNLPQLSDAQTLKLRQLTLLSLASDRTNLTYSALQHDLGLSSTREIESLIITAIYAGLLDATLDPARQAVQVTSVAPLRDLSPGSVPHMIAALDNWSDCCTNTLSDLEAHVANIRANAAARAKEKRVTTDRVKSQMSDLSEDRKGDGSGGGRDVLARRGLNKRSMAEAGKAQQSVDAMDIEGALETLTAEKRASKRKM